MFFFKLKNIYIYIVQHITNALYNIQIKYCIVTPLKVIFLINNRIYPIFMTIKYYNILNIIKYNM